MDKYDLLEKQIDWKNLLIANYKSLGLSEDEVMTILVIQYCLDQNEKTITPELINLLTNYPINKASDLLSNLLNKGLMILEDENNNLVTSLKGIKRILIDDFIKNSEETKENQSDLYLSFEQGFGRPLTFAETEMIKNWINEGNDERKIKTALKQALINNVKNMKYIDKILLNWNQEEERKKEGYTTISQDWRKNIIDSLDELDKDENK